MTPPGCHAVNVNRPPDTGGESDGPRPARGGGGPSRGLSARDGEELIYKTRDARGRR